MDAYLIWLLSHINKQSINCKIKLSAFKCAAMLSLVTLAISSVVNAKSEASVLDAEKTGGKLPLEAFASLPDVSHVSLSPSGEKVVSIIRVDAGGTKGSAIQVANIDTGEKKIVLFNDNKKYFIHWMKWKDDTTLIVGYFYPFKTFRWESRETRMLIIDTEKDEIRTPFKESSLEYNYIQRDRVVDFLKDDPDHILVELYSRAGRIVYRLNIKNKHLKRVHNPVDKVHSWKTDRQQEIRYGYYYHGKKGIAKSLVKRPSDGKWLRLWEYEPTTEDYVRVLGFGKNPSDVYIQAYHNDLLALFRVDLNDKNLKRELIYSDAEYDAGGYLVYSPISNDVIGYGQYKIKGSRENGGIVFFDSEWKKVKKQIDKALPNTKNDIVSFSDDMQRYLVYSSSSIESGTFYIGDRKKGSLGILAYRYKSLAPDLMAEKTNYSYKARDGLDIESFLTLPKGKDHKELPTIVYPRSYMFGYENDGFDYWVQFFANRGYAVLQANFRGAYGKGAKFQQSGYQQWGKEMQSDIDEGVKKLIEDGIADKNNVCIVGLGFGGHAALMGTVKSPNLYKCAISVNGISDAFKYVKRRRSPFSSFNIIDKLIGNNNKYLREISPLNHVDKITAPILLIHASNDRNISMEHSVDMHKALKKAGKEVEFIELENEEHNLENGENRVKAFAAMEKFLAKHLPVK